ncbi:MAG: hypothetical protein MUC96_03170 [Myxococcaceae bacterium]|jgi:hypothetical protein|nr:hypothetical protein [Myxococcaceae bacterium]
MTQTLALSLAVVPFLAGRPLLAAGLLAMLMGLRLAWDRGTWDVGGFAVSLLAGVLGVVLQVLAERVRDLAYELVELSRELERRLHEVVAITLSVLFAASTLGMLGQRALERTGFALAGVSGDAWKLVLVAVLAWAFARLRGRLGSLFDGLPVSGTGGLGRVLFLAECWWVVCGLALALTFPLVGAGLALASLVGLLVLVVLLRRFIEGSRTACEACGASVHRAASTCPSCRHGRSPARLAPWGRPVSGAPDDDARHRLGLLLAHRCPSCAERLGRDPRRVCASCGNPPWNSSAERTAFVHSVDRRVAVLVPVFAAAGLLPGVGLPLALLFFKLSPAGALTAFGDWTASFRTQVVRAAAVLVLAALQPLPLFGAAAAVGVVVLLHLWSRRAFVRHEPGAALAPVV